MNNNFYNKLTISIGLFVSLATIIVSAAEVFVAKINSDSILEVEKLKIENELALKKSDSDRKFKLDLFSLVIDNNDLLLSAEDNKILAKEIFLSHFRVDLSYEIYSNISELYDERTFWFNSDKDEDDSHDIIYPRVKIYYDDEYFDRFISLIGDTLSEGDVYYDYQDQKIPKGLTKGDIRYFHDIDYKLAKKVKRDVESLLEDESYIFELKLIPLTDSPKRSPIGSIEVWLSKENAKLKSKKQ